MKLLQVGVLRGPNAWAACPVLEVSLDLGESAALPRDRLLEIAERVAVWFPALVMPRALRASEGNGTGGAREDALNLASLFQRVALQFQVRAGNAVQFGAIRPLAQSAHYRIAIGYQ